MIFDEHELDIELYASELKSRIETRANRILAIIEKWLQTYQMKIDTYAETSDVIYREITAQFDSIDQRIQQYLWFVILPRIYFTFIDILWFSSLKVRYFTVSFYRFIFFRFFIQKENSFW